jgi:hypothetical protein
MILFRLGKIVVTNAAETGQKHNLHLHSSLSPLKACHILHHTLFFLPGSFSIMKFNPFTKIKKGTEKLVLIGITSALLLVGLFDCLKQLYLLYIYKLHLL